MSMDELAQELERFGRALDEFVEVLKTSAQHRAEVEDRAAGLWDDAFRREFQRRYGEYAGPVAAFTEAGAARYQAFVDQKLRQVRRYLDG